MTILVIAEHNNAELNPATFNTITAAAELGEITVLVAGHNCEEVAKSAATINGVAKVLHADAEHYANLLAEEVVPLVAQLADDYEYILASSSNFGKNLCPRIAALLDVAQISDITSIVAPDTFTRPIYAGNAIATVQSHDNKKVITVRSVSFDAAETGGNAEIKTIEATAATGLSSFVSQELATSDRPELAVAKTVVSGGRGVGSEDNFAIIEALADKLGGAVGASRAAVDAGYIANDKQVGQTGVVVAPELYIAVGISGAAQHIAGMKDSKVIVAINKDPEAAIFNYSDYGLVADLFEAVPELTNSI